MKCRKAFEVDLADFVVDEGAARFAAFRAHYPACPDCRDEVAVWNEVQAQLRADGGATDPSHPPKDLLLRYEVDRQSLLATESEALARHLANCRSCPDELAALRTFDFSVVSGRARSRPATGPNAVVEAVARMRLVLLHPAFAYALVLVLLYSAFVRPRLAARHVPLEQQAVERGRWAQGEDVVPPVANGMPAIESDVQVAVAPPNPMSTARPVAEQQAADIGKRPARKEPRTRPGKKPLEPAIAARPSPREPVAPVGGATVSAEAFAHDDLDDPDVEDTRVLGLAASEEPNVASGQARTAVAWLSIPLAPDRAPVVERTALTSGIVLRLPPSAGGAAASVVGPEGRDVPSAIVQPSTSGVVEVRVRAGDLVAGAYRVRWNRSELHFSVR